MNDDGCPRGESPDLHARRRARRSVRAVISDDHNYDRGIVAVREVVAAVLVEAGVEGLADVAVELSLTLASALERIAAGVRKNLCLIQWYTQHRGPSVRLAGGNIIETGTTSYRLAHTRAQRAVD